MPFWYRLIYPKSAFISVRSIQRGSCMIDTSWHTAPTWVDQIIMAENSEGSTLDSSKV